MPVKRIKSPRSEDIAPDLVAELAAERRAGDTSDTGGPDVIIEEIKDRGPLHVFVIWAKWEPLDHMTRSDLVMQACDAALSPAELRRITFANGMTPLEYANTLGNR